MPKRFRKLVASVASLAALALGGAVFAQAQSGSEPPAGPDRDTLQQGDQTTPDRATATVAKMKIHHRKAHRSHPVRASGARAAASERPGAESSEQAAEPAGEATSESAGPSDGPGGHADEAGGGSANADHQFQGVE